VVPSFELLQFGRGRHPLWLQFRTFLHTISSSRYRKRTQWGSSEVAASTKGDAIVSETWVASDSGIPAVTAPMHANELTSVWQLDNGEIEYKHISILGPPTCRRRG